MLSTAVNTAKEWVLGLTNLRSITPSQSFEHFWEQKEPHWHESPTRFQNHLLSKHQIQQRLDPNTLYDDSTYNLATKVRFVCTSDTHNQTDKCNFHIPDGDVLIHAGDFTQVGSPKEVHHFADWLDSLPHPIKIVIPGNHELSFDPVTADQPRFMAGSTKPTQRESLITRLSQSCTYLEDSSAVVHGIRLFGSPCLSLVGGHIKRGKECVAKWKEIPEDTDFLITHGPPAGHGDTCRGGIRAGCVDLLQEVQCRVKPQFHLFGHIHEDGGVTTDSQTVYINGSMCNLRYRPQQHPIVVDMDKVSDELVLQSAPPVWNLSDPRDADISSNDGIEFKE